MSRTIGNSYLYGITLSSAGDNPVTVTGTISAGSGAALYGTSPTAWTVTNSGQIYASGNYGIGIQLKSGGSVTNLSGGTIASAGYEGVYIAGTGTVINSGSIGASHDRAIGIFFKASDGAVTNEYGGTITGLESGVENETGTVLVTNYGDIAATQRFGIYSFQGGTVTNQTSGTISGQQSGIKLISQNSTVINAGTIYGATQNGIVLSYGYVSNQASGTITGNYAGIYIYNDGASTVVNAGSIGGTTVAVQFRAGVTGERVVIDPGAVFSGTVNGGNTVVIGAAAVSTLELASGASAGTLTGLGTQYINFANITIDSGATWTLASASLGANYTIYDSGTLTNTGSLGSAVTLTSGAYLSNAATGTIVPPSGFDAIVGVAGGPATVVNGGDILSSGLAFTAIDLGGGGAVTNLSGGIISGSQTGIFILGAATVVNDGSIAGTSNIGVNLYAGGGVTNESGRTIAGNYGVRILNGAGTLTNAGSISGGSGTAATFAAGFANRLIVDPGASFSGKVDGGNTLSGSAVSTLELASGASAGTLSGLGTQYFHFADITIDSGATWTLSSASLGAGYTIYDSGTLTNTGSLGSTVTLTGGAMLTNATGATITAGYAVIGQGTVINDGSLIGGSGTAVALGAGFANRVAIAPDAYFGGTVDGGNTIGATHVSTLELTTGASIGTLSGLGSQYVDFSQVTVDQSATWTLASSIASGVTLTNNGTINSEVSLAAGAYLTNASTGTISTTSGDPVDGFGGAVTVANAGLISSPNEGVRLADGGLVLNRAGGTISTDITAIFVDGAAGTVINAGSIASLVQYGIDLHEGGTVTNQSGGTITGSDGIHVVLVPGTIVNAGQITGIHNGIYQVDGGVVTNQSGGDISSSGWGVLTRGGTVVNAGSITGSVGIQLTGVGTVINAGYIGGTTGTAVNFAAGYGNRLVVDPGATFSGTVDASGATLELASGASAGTLTGLGTKYINAANITIDSGATWTLVSDTLGAGYTIRDSGTLTNTGSLGSTVTLGAGSVLTNAATATIATSGYAVIGQGTLVNAGSISGGSGTAVSLTAGFANRVVIDPNAVFTGTVDGGDTPGDTAASTLELASGTSAGTLSGLGYNYINFSQLIVDPGATWIFNSSSAFAGTLTNAGTIGGSIGSAPGVVQFAYGHADRLIMDPGAAFHATVDGGNAYGSPAVSTLELASGASAGTLSGFGSQYYNFTNITIDSGANWTLGSASIGANHTIYDSGTLTNTGTLGATVTLGAGGVLINAANATISTVGYAVTGQGTVVNDGNLLGGNGTAVALTAGFANRVAIAPGAYFYGTINGGNTLAAAYSSTLELMSATSAGTLSGLGYNYVNFSQLVVDPGATWIFDPCSAFAGTLTNAGTIGGSIGPVSGVVQFAYGYADRLIMDPGAAFQASVDGGNGFISTAASTLELASGATAGTLSGLGTKYFDFTNITIDSGATWTLAFDALGAGYTITDSGTLTNTGSLGSEVVLGSGAHLINASAASISVIGSNGVYSSAAATVVNAGAIYGSYNAGIELLGGGNVTNQSGGSISGSSNGIYIFGSNATVINAGSITGNTFGVELTGGAGTVINAGYIKGGSSAVYLASGYRNRLVVDPGAKFSGLVNGGNTVGATAHSTLELASGASAGTLTSLGSQYVNFANITIDNRATWTFASDTLGSGYRIFDKGTLTNTGSLYSGVTLGTGAVLTNVSGATISAPGGVFGVYATAVNAGYVAGVYGIYMYGGAVTNLSGGTIYGAIFGVLAPVFSTLTNAGSIYGHLAGVFLPVYGVATNRASGTITGEYTGAYFKHGGTLVNAGSIGGGTNAVYFNYGYNNLLVIDPGAVFSGAVDGGNPAGCGYTSTLELASGTSYGTLSGLGSKYYGFSQIVVDPGATWIFNSSSSAFAGTFINAGTIGGSIGSVSDVVQFASGYADRLIMVPGASFYTAVDGGNTLGATVASTLELASGASAGTLHGLGSSNYYYNFANVTIDSGATWTLASASLGSGYTVYDSGTLTNTGSIGSEVTLGVGAVLTNVSGATISSGTAIYGSNLGAVTVVNAGDIAGTSEGVNIIGALINQSGGTITGGQDGALIYGPYALINAGSIGGQSASGVGVFNGATVTNQATGIITGGSIGVYGARGGTVVNAGSIGGGTYAVRLALGADNRVVVDPGAVFSGSVDGGNTLFSTSASTLELASGTIAGTLSGLGTKYFDFANITIDSGATWTLTSSLLGIGYSIGDSGTLTNTGNLGSTVTLTSGAALTNALGATIAGNKGRGVYGAASGVTVVNASYITGNIGVALVAGGGVTNVSSATIYGYLYGVVSLGAATLTNAGTIAAFNIAGIEQIAGVDLQSGGVITNQATGTITGGSFGVEGANTLVNAGSIGGGTVAVDLRPGYADTLIVDPGAVFRGTVSGGNAIGATASSTLELASAATTGTLSGLGSQYIDFANMTVDANATWTLAAADTIVAGATLTELSGAKVTDTGTLINNGAIVLDPSTMNVNDLSGTGTTTLDAGSTLTVQTTLAGGQTIAFDGSGAYLHLQSPSYANGSVTNFGLGNTIDLAGVNPASVAWSDGTVSFDGGSFPLDIVPGNTLVVTPSSDGAELTALCFRKNTRILTPSGERSVQDLAVGDLVMTYRGEKRPIAWIGTGQVLATRGRRNAATPVIIKKGALDDNMPNRDLHVTKGHAILVGDVLIPVEFLVNHRSILWDDLAQEVPLYHIELETHDVLVANGAPAESYRDDGNRWLFRNANSGWDLPPQESCAQLLTGGPLVDEIWRWLLDRAGPRPGMPTTDEPDLHLLVDGERVDPVERSDNTYVFHLPMRPNSVRLASRAGTPQELGLARDPRSLGAAIQRIVLRKHGGRPQVLKADDARLADGFHAFEPDKGFRWTNGDACLPMSFFRGINGACFLEIDVACTTLYSLLADIDERSAA